MMTAGILGKAVIRMATRSVSHGSARLRHFVSGSGLQWGPSLKRSPSWIFGNSFGFTVGLITWPTGRNWLLLGPPRSGKGASFFVPTLLSAPDQPEPRPSIVVTDPKAELLAIARERLESQGYKIHIIAFDQPDLSDGFDPLPWLSGQNASFGGIDYGAAQHLSQTVVPHNPEEKDPFWSNTARTIIAAAAVLAYKTGDTFADALGLAYQIALSKPDALAEHVQAFRAIDPWAAAQLQGIVSALGNNPKLAGDMAADLIARFAPWTTPAMLSIFSRPSFQWSDVLEGDQPHAVFIVAASHHAEQQAVVIASLIAAAHRIQRRQNRLDRPLWMLGDEFGNVGPIPNLMDALTTLSGAGVSMALGLQSTAQLESVYGESLATVALEALHGYVSFPGLGFDSAQWVSDRLGQTTVSTWSRSTAMDNSRQWTKGEHERAVMLADEVSRLRAGFVVIQRAGFDGLTCRVSPYYRHRRFANEARLANPAHPQIAAALNAMRQDISEPPGAWDLGEQLLGRLVPSRPETAVSELAPAQDPPSPPALPSLWNRPNAGPS